MQLLGGKQSGVAKEPPVGRDEEMLDRDRVFTLLKNPRRRAVLTQLTETPATTLSDLADNVAADENDTTPEQLSSSERKRVYISLYQNHLPKLAEFDVIEYDQSRGDVQRRDRARQLQWYLDRLDHDTSTSRSGTVQAVGSLVGVVSLAGVVGLPEISVVWAFLAGAGLLGVSLYEWLGGGSLTAGVHQRVTAALAAVRR